MENLGKIKKWFWALLVFGIGVAMIVNPELMEGASASGRNFIVKKLFIWVWGIPGGIVLLVIGGIYTYSILKEGKTGKTEET